MRIGRLGRPSLPMATISDIFCQFSAAVPAETLARPVHIQDFMISLSRRPE